MRRTRSDDIGKTKNPRLDIVPMRVGGTVRLAGQFCRAVERHRNQRTVVLTRGLLDIPVDRGRRREDELRRLVLRHGLEYGPRREEGLLEIDSTIEATGLDVAVRRKVKHDVKFPLRDNRLECLVENVEFVELDIVPLQKVLDVLAAPQAEVIDQNETVTPLDEMVAHMTGDKAGTTRYQNSHDPL